MTAGRARRPGELAWSYVEPFWAHVSVCEGPELFLQQFATVPEYCRHLLATHYLTTEVCNGGFDQLFCNSTGIVAPEAVKGFRAIGMPQTADVVAAAMGMLGPVYPRDHGLRQDMLAALYPDDDVDDEDRPSVFDALDDRFYDLIERENGGAERASDAFAARFPVPEPPPPDSFDAVAWLRDIFGDRRR